MPSGHVDQSGDGLIRAPSFVSGSGEGFEDSRYLAGGVVKSLKASMRVDVSIPWSEKGGHLELENCLAV